MKRTVKAWAWVWFSDEALVSVCLVRPKSIPTNGRYIPCTITYDDGRKPAKRKRKGA